MTSPAGGGEAAGGAWAGGQAEGEGEEGRRADDLRWAQQGIGGRRVTGAIFSAVVRLAMWWICDYFRVS